MRQLFTMTIPNDMVISNNRDAKTWRRQRTKDFMRELTRVHGRGLYPCKRATIFVGITKRTSGIYDPTNIADTFKGCVDELVTMGILDEDNYHYVAGPWCFHAGVDKRVPEKHLRATVTLTDYSPIPFGGAS